MFLVRAALEMLLRPLQRPILKPVDESKPATPLSGVSKTEIMLRQSVLAYKVCSTANIRPALALGGKSESIRTLR